MKLTKRGNTKIKILETLDTVNIERSGVKFDDRPKEVLVNVRFKKGKLIVDKPKVV